jgi:hypothetical protein
VIEEEGRLSPELEARIAALEADNEPSDFDARGWILLLLFGVVLPLALLVIGFRV